MYKYAEQLFEKIASEAIKLGYDMESEEMEKDALYMGGVSGGMGLSRITGLSKKLGLPKPPSTIMPKRKNIRDILNGVQTEMSAAAKAHAQKIKDALKTKTIPDIRKGGKI